MGHGVTLVTGANGFIGRRLLGSKTRPLVRTPHGFPDEMIGDLTCSETIERACKGVEQVFHCAGFAHRTNGHQDKNRHEALNLNVTRNLAWAAGKAGVRTFVFLSSVKAMGNTDRDCVDETWDGVPTDPYGLAKRLAEIEVVSAGKAYGMKVVNLRLAMVYGRGGKGNLARMAHGIKAGWFPPIPETGNRRSIIHIDDVVSAVRHVALTPEANGKSYIIANFEAPSGRGLYNAIRSQIGYPPVSWEVPEGLLRTAARIGDYFPDHFGMGKIISREIISRLLDTECYCPASIHRDLGWRAGINLEAGLREMFGHEKSP